jgi:aspartate/methionine/tyrosine aminotransferase
VCLSKGLGAPVGSVIVGSQSFIEKAKTVRKTLGGGMRQIGVLCAAALVALQENLPKLQHDHKKAKLLAEGLNQMKGIRVNVAAVETNMVRIDTTIVCFSSSSTTCIMPDLISNSDSVMHQSLGLTIKLHNNKFRFSWIWRMVQDLRLRNCGRI